MNATPPDTLEITDELLENSLAWLFERAEPGIDPDSRATSWHLLSFPSELIPSRELALAESGMIKFELAKRGYLCFMGGALLMDKRGQLNDDADRRHKLYETWMKQQPSVVPDRQYTAADLSYEAMQGAAVALALALPEQDPGNEAIIKRTAKLIKAEESKLARQVENVRGRFAWSEDLKKDSQAKQARLGLVDNQKNSGYM